MQFYDSTIVIYHTKIRISIPKSSFPTFYVLIKHRTWRSEADSEASTEDLDKQTRLHYKETKSWRLKKRALENVYDLFDDLDEESEGGDEVDMDGELPEAPEGQDEKVSQAAQMGDPTYEMANVRRYIVGKQSLSKLLANSREMFLLRVSC